MRDIDLTGKNIAIIGGGKFCKGFIKYLYSLNYVGPGKNGAEILGVADTNEQAEGIELAGRMGIYTCNDYKKFYEFEDLQVILELTKNNLLIGEIKKTMPSGVVLIDHFDAVLLWNFLQLEEIRVDVYDELLESSNNKERIIGLFDKFTDGVGEVIKKSTDHSLRVERDLAIYEENTSQIIHGSTMPTFVINKDHIVTHWNKALEKLTGYPADKIVGTDKQWKPFRKKKRPVMADVILDQLPEEEIRKYYGANWRKSPLVEGGYEAEEYFPNLGGKGKWAFFTGAPIKRNDGKIIGAIETLWDTTEKNEIEEERERRAEELSALCSIFIALNNPSRLDTRVITTIEETIDLLSADSACVFILINDKIFYHKYKYGELKKDFYRKSGLTEKDSFIYRVMESDKLTIFEDLPEGENNEIGLLAEEGLRSLIYMPISSKGKSSYGVIRFGIKKSRHLSDKEKDVLELIRNRIGVTVDNTILAARSKRSEEKFRSLFNNDPNPIFIIDKKTLKILDNNHRAENCYGYTNEQLNGMAFTRLGDSNDIELTNRLKDLLKDESVFFPKKRHFKRGGLPFYVNVNVCDAQYRENNVLIATTTDITESVEREVQLIQASKMTTLGLMASGMAHEINQPLNVIQVCADFLLKMQRQGVSIKDEDLKSVVNDIRDNVQRASGIIKHMRDFARQSEVVKNSVNINDPIKDVFKVMGHQLKVHKIILDLELDPDIPNIMADHNRLEQVFINLVTNAIDALDDRENEQVNQEWKKLLTIKSFSESGQVIATVSDTGTGMPHEVIEKIFEPFFTTKEVGKGTGLGISISHGIVKDYDGEIEIQSEVGVGSTFKLGFPVIDG